jgi:hypothetical protein
MPHVDEIKCANCDIRDIKNVGRNLAYFISPKGVLYEVLEHITFVKTNPEIFGFSTPMLQVWENIYKSDLREYVLYRVLSNGWIRVRYDPQSQTFTMQVAYLNFRMATHIYEFAQALRETINKNATLKIIDCDNCVVEIYPELHNFFDDDSFIYKYYRRNFE